MGIKCYAACLGNCSNKQSIEHYVSKGIWNNSLITFEGLDWSGDQPKTLPVKRVGLKILCKTHNEALSPLDMEQKKFFRTLETFFHHLYERKDAKRSAIWKVDRASFDGHILERMFAKIATGVVNEQPYRKWHLTDTEAIEPPREVVEVIFGRRKFEPPMGLYFVNAVGDPLYNEDRVQIQTLYSPGKDGYIGSIVSLRQLQFFINLSDLDPDEYTMLSTTNVKIGRGGSPLTYRHALFNFHSRGKLSGRITFEW